MSFVLPILLISLPAFAPDTSAAQADPAKEFIKKMDAARPEDRVPNWEKTRTLMSRIAPAVGEKAPDFTLKTIDEKETVTLSKFQGEKPVVLIFGSFT